ncbi:Peptide chain release factor 1 [Lactococcus cremoris]|uniref:PCRF domain-containing protein n=1 Tax=Lactococcus lactis subsp. cremoris TaxID=1359 RepID=UPI002907A28C|nr:PCRF domain-containing protein [Lactococcus cremoris]MDU8930552.1 Peptide chain release factor 1 [Lactococcus cremoris]
MFDQLESIVGRYEELGELLSDPEVVSDTKRFMELSREEADLRDKVATYNEYKKVLETISDSEEMLGEGGLDDEMKEMVKEELSSAKSQKEVLEEESNYFANPNNGNKYDSRIRESCWGRARFCGDINSINNFLIFKLE